MPDDLREQINALAKANNRSVNTEIVLMLQQAMAEKASLPGLNVDALVEALTPKLAEEIAAKVAAKLQGREK